eukprot:gnl/Spiro4/18956_TR10102_c0_g1_i1.p1 gnl/Spiro4/18956_TR10102_c0_g1~~gnl/Spiro4/18956_TR10102_c0_g1_i1.p1  ORF type:complete len:381 (-),score=92.56 gnl/Spiro4/18956_TR10102_c0_g1_i1:39-1181(-)
MRCEAVLVLVAVLAVAVWLGQGATRGARKIDELPNIRAWAADGSFFNYGGHAIFFRHYVRPAGRAPPRVTATYNNVLAASAPPVIAHPLFLLHGFPTSSFDWASVWEDLGDAFSSIVAPDFLGFGLSDKPHGHHYSVLEQSPQADIIEQLCAHLGYRKVHLLAHDFGDSVAQELMARYLELPATTRAAPSHSEPVTRDPNIAVSVNASRFHILSVCLLNGGLFPETHRPILVQRLLLMPAVAPIVKFFNCEMFFRASMNQVFGNLTQRTPAQIEEMWALFSHKDGAENVDLLLRYMHERVTHRERWVAALQLAGSRGVAVRLINGPLDPISGLHMTKRYEQLVSNPDVVLLDNHIGHYPQLEDPSEVVRLYLPFVRFMAQ